MNLKEVEYIIKIAEEQNVTKAAEKLFLTPSALNQQLHRLEKEVGTPLFFRERNRWLPTEAGMIYLDAAKELLRIKRETYHRIQDIAQLEKGHLSIGLPPDRGSAMFSQVYPVFHQQYPEIIVNIHEVTVRKQQQMIASGELDIGFITLCESQQTEDDHIFITSEEIILAVPSCRPVCRDALQKPGLLYPELNIRLLKDEPFALLCRESTMREFINTIFRQTGFSPFILLETARVRTILDMVDAGMCCGLVSATYADLPYENISYFSLPSHPAWDIMASFKKGSYLNKPMKFFIQLASDYWNPTKDSSGVSMNLL